MAEGFTQLDCNEEMLQQPIPKSKCFFLVLLIAEFYHTSECQNKFLTTSFTLTVLNFCGPGNVSVSGELGYFGYIDQCCKTHDRCLTTWQPHAFKRGLENTSRYTLSDCSCDNLFFECLKNTYGIVKNVIDFAFKISVPQCAYFGYKQKCTAFSLPFGHGRCVKYERDVNSTNKDQHWQLRDNPPVITFH